MKPIWLILNSSIACAPLLFLVVCAPLLMKPAFATEYLSPLSLQTLNVGEQYRLGIRPSSAVDGVTNDIELSIKNLPVNAGFQQLATGLWELSWFPSAAQVGPYALEVWVLSQTDSSQVLQKQTLRFRVGVPNALATIFDTATDPITQDDQTASAPSTEATVKITESVQLIAPFEKSRTEVQEVAAAHLEEPPVLRLMDEPSEPSEPTRSKTVATSIQQIKPVEWQLQSLTSHIVSADSWLRFGVKVEGDAALVNEQVTFEVDGLPAGATFAPWPSGGGGRLFEWQPTAGDAGVHSVQFTAIDRYDSNKRESVRVRIIVQEG